MLFSFFATDFLRSGVVAPIIASKSRVFWGSNSFPPQHEKKRKNNSSIFYCFLLLSPSLLIYSINYHRLIFINSRHGAYHPGFAKRINSNSNEDIKEATDDAFGHYAKNPADIEAVIKKISALNGIGPATASLLLAVHDPDHVIYFSDELFRWLLNDGASSPKPKYTNKEFENLFAKAKAVTSKLKVTPIALEKVAFVLIKENEPVREKAEPKMPSGRGRGRPALPDSEKKAKKPTVPGRGRGRPPTGAVAKTKTPKVAKSPAAVTSGGKKRGRPAKAAAEEETEPKSTPASVTPGKKRKAADDETPAKKGKKAKA